MALLFGTDGIRGIAGQYPLDRDTIYRTGRCLTEHLRSLHPRPHIIIARDTRRSGPWIESLLLQAIHDAGGTEETCGVLSTPAVSFLTSLKGVQAGVMISASHNPFRDNGIKVFSSAGVKFTNAVEEELEKAILSCSAVAPVDVTEDQAFAANPVFASERDNRELYIRHLMQVIPAAFSLRGMRLVVDCAHGSQSAIAPDFLSMLGAEVHPIHCEPDGCNINHHAGALHPERLQDEVVRMNAHIGIAFDGDADRAMFVDSGGTVRDGDYALYLLARHLQWDDAPRVVVGTVMSNLGLEVALQELGFQFTRAAVGDRYVLEEMLRTGAVLGGEQSGHVIMSRFAPTGDGLLTALKVLEILVAQQKDLAALCMPVKRFPQVLLNVPVAEKAPMDDIPGLRAAEAECRQALGPRSRILLRYSGTEKLARVMVEGEDESLVRNAADRLASILKTTQNGV